MAVSKRQRREKKGKRNKGRSGVRTSGRKNTQPSWPAPFTLGRLRGRRKTEEEPKLSRGLLFSSCLLGQCGLTPGGCISLCLPIKLSCKHWSVCRFKFLLRQDRTKEITHSLNSLNVSGLVF